MARSNSGSALKFIGAGAAAIVGGVAIGYLFGGARTPRPAEQIAPQVVPVVSTPVRSSPPPDTRLHAGDGNYTAPGAPHITIQEESAPTMRRVNRTVPPPPADTEASQEASPVKPPAGQTPTTNSQDTNTGSDTTTPADSTTPATNPASNSPDTPTTPPKVTNPPNKPSAPAAPADPDFEHVIKPGDAESTQEGGSKAQYRVQTGAYTDEGNARSIADQLRGQGYTASTRSEREGDHLVYKVQAGAYRSKNGANKAAEDLQKKGFPAYVSPLTP